MPCMPFGPRRENEKNKTKTVCFVQSATILVDSPFQPFPAEVKVAVFCNLLMQCVFAFANAMHV